MRLHSGRLSHFRARCRQRGVDYAAATACIVSTDGDRITVDLDHATYPRPRPRPTSAQIWHAAHVRSGQPVLDHAAEQRHLDRLADGTGCETCKTHWRERRKSVRIDTFTPASYAYGLWFEHNVISTIAGRPLMSWHTACADYGWGA